MRFDPDKYACINAAGMRAHAGNSRLSESVIDAMNRAARSFVYFPDFLHAANTHVASLLDVPAAAITSGASAALAMISEALFRAPNPVARYAMEHDRTPILSPALIAIPASHRTAYDLAFDQHKAELADPTSFQDLVAISRTRNIRLVLLIGRNLETTEFSIARIRQHLGSTPKIVVDAAAQTPEQARNWLREGADAVIISGGKTIAGPASTAIVIGTKPMIAGLQALSTPSQGLGRPYKLSKEGIAGCVAALEEWLADDGITTLIRQARQTLAVLRDSLKPVPGIEIRISDSDPRAIPTATIIWNMTNVPVTGAYIRRRLLLGSPPVLVNAGPTEAPWIQIDPACVCPIKEAPVLGEALRNLFSQPVVQTPVPPHSSWEFAVEYLDGLHPGKLALHEAGATLDHLGLRLNGTVHADPDLTTVSFRHVECGRYLQFAITSCFDSEQSRGTLTSGGSMDRHQGEPFSSQYGRYPIVLYRSKMT